MAIFLAGPSAIAQVLINEIHYDPDVKTEAVEFIELHNAGAIEVDLAGWRVSSAVDFVIPAGVRLAAGGYLVIAQDPAALLAKYGASALGPWVGRLENDGEEIVLRDAQDQVVDRVEYQLGFPWPTVGDSPGYSIELVHPGFDNDLGGNWRASLTGGATPTASTLVQEGSTWKYFKGLEEASDPTTAWRQVGFDDSAWTEGQTPLGYGETWLVTRLDDMRNNYTSVFLRKTFRVEDPAAFGALTLEAQFDDGFKAWVNGTIVVDGNANLQSGEVAHNAVANSALEDFDFRTFAVPGLAPTILRTGTNVLAIQVHNSSLSGSSDCFIDARLLAAPAGSAGRGPTPGVRNCVFTNNVPPQIRQVEHSPAQPRGGEEVRITAKITDPEGVSQVHLEYQIVEPGQYIELDDAAYATQWITVTMNDAGTEGDALAGDSVYTARLPNLVQQHRRLVRYRLVATDGDGLTVRVPYPDDPQPNFAYFVYDGVPGWAGSIRPGVEPVLTFAASEMGRLPVYHLISRRADVEDCTWFSRYGGDQYLWRGTLVYDGRVYDHVRYRARGGVWRYAMVKNMWKFRFNRGHYFQARDDWGRKFDTRWSRLNLGASIQQGDYLHRGEQGMFESVGFRLFNLAGVEASHTAFITFRIVDEANESDSSTQFEGDFWGVYLVTEQVDGRFLDEHGLPDGNLFKMEGGTGPPGAGGELKNQGPTQVTDTSDLIAFRSTYESNPGDAWWRENVDLPRYYSYQAILQAIHHYDVPYGKNYYYYSNPETARWQVHPWDLDLTWADNMFVGGASGGGEPFKSRVLSDFSNTPARPEFTIAFKNRVREICDLLYNTDQAWRLIDEYATLLRGTNNGPTILDADRAMWDYNPKMVSGTYSTSPSSKAGHGRFYQAGTPTKDFAGMVHKMKDYVQYRSSSAALSPAGGGLDGLARDTAIPGTPTVAYAGPPGYPLNRLSFEASTYTGANAFAERSWRIAQITPPDAPAANPDEPNKYEIDAVWESGSLTGIGDLTVEIPSSAVRVGSTYRVRCRVKDRTGRASHWSAPIEFVVGPPDNEPALVENLRVTELMYHAAAGSDYDFIELQNRSADVTLDLNGVKFTDGIDFAFDRSWLLAPGAYVVVVAATNQSDYAAFRQHYGLDASVNLAGPYAGGLANDGELITVKAGRAGVEIVSFTYNDGLGWPLAADGAGHSLVVLERAVADQATGAVDYGGNWRASSYQGGSPGGPDPPPPPAALVLNEMVAHTDYSDAQHPEYDSNDWLELYNVSAVAVSLADYYLSDDPQNLRQWALPSQSLDPGAWVTFDEVSGFHHPITTGFGLDKAGEQVLLSYLPAAGAGRVVDAIKFKAQANARSLGRYPDGVGSWYELLRTAGQANGVPLSRVVIQEIMFYPPGTNGVDNIQDEYIELYNPTARAIELFDTNGTWRLDGGIAFDLPANISLEPGEALVVVSFDPASPGALGAFQNRYGITNAARILGPYTGKLSNRSERVALERPQSPDLAGGSYSWIVVDQVIYGNQDPWPPDARGTGRALHRLSAVQSGDDPANWGSGAPTPGEAEPVLVEDSDRDGLPDVWEERYFQTLERDGTGDYDGDGLTDLEEYVAGTDPLEYGSVLRLEVINGPDPPPVLRFVRAPDRFYRVEYRNQAGNGAWQEWIAYPPDDGGGAELPLESLPGGEAGRFYRLVVW